MCTGLLQQVCFVQNLFNFVVVVSHNWAVSHNWVSVPYLVNLLQLLYLADIWKDFIIKHVHVVVDVHISRSSVWKQQ